MDEKSTPWILAIGGLVLVLVFFVMNKQQQQPVVVQQKSSDGGIGGALTSLVGLGTAIINKMDF